MTDKPAGRIGVPDAQLTGMIIEAADATGVARLGVSSDFKFQFSLARPYNGRYCELEEYIHDARIQLSDGMRPGSCVGGALPPLRCSLPQVWQRAIAGGAPLHARARITLTGRRWQIEVDGHVSNGGKTPMDQEFDDDCQPVVEH